MSKQETDTVSTTPQIEPTVAIIADRRASQLFLKETIQEILSLRGIKHGYVDISSLPGLAAAEACITLGIPFDSLEFGQERTYETLRDSASPTASEPFSEDDAARIRASARSEYQLSIDDLGTINANPVIIPAPVAVGEKLIDFSPSNISGVMLQQLAEDHSSFILVDTPERGLTVDKNGAYLRTVILVQPGEDSDTDLSPEELTNIVTSEAASE